MDRSRQIDSISVLRIVRFLVLRDGGKEVPGTPDVTLNTLGTPKHRPTRKEVAKEQEY